MDSGRLSPLTQDAKRLLPSSLQSKLRLLTPSRTSTYLADASVWLRIAALQNFVRNEVHSKLNYAVLRLGGWKPLRYLQIFQRLLSSLQWDLSYRCIQDLHGSKRKWITHEGSLETLWLFEWHSIDFWGEKYRESDFEKDYRYGGQSCGISGWIRLRFVLIARFGCSFIGYVYGLLYTIMVHGMKSECCSIRNSWKGRCSKMMRIQMHRWLPEFKNVVGVSLFLVDLFSDPKESNEITNL